MSERVIRADLIGINGMKPHVKQLFKKRRLPTIRLGRNEIIASVRYRCKSNPFPVIYDSGLLK